MAKDGNNSIRRHGRKLYLFAAAGLAVFVFVLAIGRLRTGQMIATAALRHEVPSGSAENEAMRPVDATAHDLLHVRQAIGNEDFLAGLLTILPADTATALEADQPSPAARVAAVRGRFEFALDEPGQDGQATGVALRFLHEQGSVAQTVVNSAASEFAKREQQAAEAALYRNPHAEAKSAARKAKRAWDEAEAAFREFTEHNQAALDRIRQADQDPAVGRPPAQAALPTDTDDNGNSSPTAEPSFAPAAEQAEGPWLADPSLVGSRYARRQIEARAEQEGLGDDAASSAAAESAWVGVEAADQPAAMGLDRLDADLEELQRIKIDLLSRVTPDHPMVIDLNGRIDKLSERLATIRKQSQANQPAATAPALSPSGDTSAAETPLTDVARTSLLARHQQLRQAADARGAEYRRLAAVERNRWLQQLDERRLPRWHVTAADRATLRHEPTSSAMLLLALAMGLTAGAGLLITSSATSGGFATVAEAEDTLPVPVIGRLPGDAPAAATPRLQRAARLALLVCEVSLAGFLVAMIVAVALDGDFAGTLRKDPLAALADGWRHLMSLWTR